MDKAEFIKHREILYRELLTQLTRIANHPVVQCQLGLREGCTEIAKNYRLLNKAIDEYIG